MKKFMMSKAMRFFFFFSGIMIWLGIYLTGFDVVHWVLYLPASFFIFAAVTGICPGIIFTKMMFKDKQG